MEQGKTSVAFQEIFGKLQEQLDRLEKNNSELSTIGNKFVDESSDSVKGIDGGNKDSRHPGLLRDLENCLERFQGLNSAYGKQLSKLQSII